ncbi:MAG: Gfo/Idh/MocA family protein [Gemmatimonadota bacterium]
MSTRRIAVMGLGEAGLGIHLPALAGMSDVTVVGACDPDPERRARAGERWGIPGFETLEELLAKSRPEVVVVATPPALHAGHVIACVESGAHVICEKPLAGSLVEVDRIAEAARRSERVVVPNHEFRLMPIFEAVLTAVAERGPVRLVDARQLFGRPPGTEAGWRGRLLRRTLFEAGVHLVDLTLALFGERPAGVVASIGSAGGRPGSDAVVVATLDFSAGRLAHLALSRIHPGRTRYLELRADTETASIFASYGGRARLIAGLEGPRPVLRLELGASGLAWCEEGDRRRTLARNGRRPRRSATRRLLAQTLAAIAEGGAPPVSLEEARAGLEVVAACYRSAELGRRVVLGREADTHLAALDLAAPAGR